MEEYSNDNSNSELKSRYNSGLSILYRMDNLWKDAHKHSRDINYPKWNEDLDRIWMELIEDAKIPDDYKQIDVLNRKIMMLKIYNSLESLKLENARLHSKIINAQKKALMEKEAFLRLLQKKQGKSSAYEDSMDDYMD